MGFEDLKHYGEKVGRGFLLVGLLGCQDQHLITPALTPAPTSETVSQTVPECVLPNPPQTTLPIDWQNWAKDAPLTLPLTKGSGVIFTRQPAEAKDREGKLKPGIFVTIEKTGAPDGKPQIVKQGFLRPFTEYFLDVEGSIVALYACDDQGEEIYWADLSE